jgi:hypothetical protein
MKTHYIQIKFPVKAGDNVTEEDMARFIEDMFSGEYTLTVAYPSGVISIEDDTKPELMLW